MKRILLHTILQLSAVILMMSQVPAALSSLVIVIP